jgi:hypothetical protein
VTERPRRNVPANRIKAMYESHHLVISRIQDLVLGKWEERVKSSFRFALDEAMGRFELDDLLARRAELERELAELNLRASRLVGAQPSQIETLLTADPEAIAGRATDFAKGGSLPALALRNSGVPSAIAEEADQVLRERGWADAVRHPPTIAGSHGVQHYLDLDDADAIRRDMERELAEATVMIKTYLGNPDKEETA